METTLLKIVRLKDDICSAELNPESPRDYDRIGASILSLMDKDDDFAKQVLSMTALYLTQRKVVGKTNEKAIRNAEIKLKN